MPEELSDHFVQVCMVGGWVMDFSEETWNMLAEEIRQRAEWLNAEDIYGCECWIATKNISGARHWTPESRVLYEQRHQADDET